MDTQKFFKAKQDLNEFINKHPFLRPMQDEIDKRLNKAGNLENRLIIMKQIITEILTENAKKWEDVRKNLKELI